MNDVLFMRCFKRFGNLHGDFQRFLDSQDGQPSLARSASVSPENQLHHQIAFRAARLFQPVNCCNVRMIERSQHFRFALKAGEAISIMREGFWQNFDRHVSSELSIVSAIHFAHAACTDRRDDFVATEMWVPVASAITFSPWARGAFSSSNQFSTTLIWCRRRLLLLCGLEHQEALAVRRDIVVVGLHGG